MRPAVWQRASDRSGMLQWGRELPSTLLFAFLVKGLLQNCPGWMNRIAIARVACAIDSKMIGIPELTLETPARCNQ